MSSTSVTAQTAPPQPGPAQSAAARQAQKFLSGGTNSLRQFGSEASSAELRAAGAALRGFLSARAAGDWGAACAHLVPAMEAALEQVGIGGKGKGHVCPAALASLNAKRSASALREAAIAKPLSLRVSGERAYLIYKGAGGVVFAVPMRKEAASWKVGSLSGLALE